MTLDLPTVGVAKKLFQVDGLEKNSEHQEKVTKLGIISTDVQDQKISAS